MLGRSLRTSEPSRGDSQELEIKCSHYESDAKLETELGWRAQETFETGIKKTVRWYVERSDWWKPLREKVYRGERLGL